MEKYAVRNEETGELLSEIFIRKEDSHITRGYKWTTNKNEAISFEFEEAFATIQFIIDVIDWEGAEDMAVWRI